MRWRAPVIIIGIDSPKGLTVLRELGRHGVPIVGVGDTGDAIGRSSRFTKRFVVRSRAVPLADFLPPLIAETGATALMAVNEEELRELSKLPAVIDGCKILTPRRAALETVLDKARTLAIAQSVGIAVPDTWQPCAGQDFAARAGRLAYPVVLKWADPLLVQARLETAGVALSKVAYAKSAEDLVAQLTPFDEIGVYPLVQAWCPGHGFGQMLMMADGRAWLRFQHRRVREWPVSGGISCLAAPVPARYHRQQMARSQALLAAIGWQGPAMVEYRYDPVDRTYRLMEVNGRFWGSVPLASHCGAEFAWAQYRCFVLGATQPEQKPLKKRRARHTIPDTKHLLSVLSSGQSVAHAWQARPSRWATLAGYLLEFLNPLTRYYVASLSDPGPAVRDLARICARRISSAGNRGS